MEFLCQDILSLDKGVDHPRVLCVACAARCLKATVSCEHIREFKANKNYPSTHITESERLDLMSNSLARLEVMVDNLIDERDMVRKIMAKLFTISQEHKDLISED